jgi:hypothetical protein
MVRSFSRERLRRSSSSVGAFSDLACPLDETTNTEASDFSGRSNLSDFSDFSDFSIGAGAAGSSRSSSRSSARCSAWG